MIVDCFISQSLHSPRLPGGKLETDFAAYEGAPTELASGTAGH